MPKTVGDWENKGWTRLDLVGGQSTVVGYDPATQDLVLKGQRFGPDGSVLQGNDRPKVAMQELANGCVLGSDVAVTVLYRIENQDEDDPAPTQLPA
jgi:hypothetical protein